MYTYIGISYIYARTADDGRRDHDDITKLQTAAFTSDDQVQDPIMKIQRLKKVQKNLAFFVNNYKFRQPYQILIDGTFCFAALEVCFLT